MRNTVRFNHPAPVVVVSDEDGVVSVGGAAWFVELLKSIRGIDLDHDAIQEDWGVVVRAQRAGRRYWIGLSAMGEHEWIAHVHHGSFSWLPKFSSAGRAALTALVRDVDHALRTAGASGVKWFEEDDVNLRVPAESPE